MHDAIRRLALATASVVAISGAAASGPAPLDPPVVVGTVDNDTSSNTHNIALTANCPAGSTLVVFTENSVNNATISDSQGGVWTSSSYVSQGGSGRYRHFYITLATDYVAGVDTITINQSTAGACQAVVALCPAAVAQSGTVASPTTNNNVQSVTTGVIAAAPAFVLAAVGINAGGDELVQTNAPAWSVLSLIGPSGSFNRALLVCYKEVSTAGGTETFSTATVANRSWGAGYVVVH